MLSRLYAELEKRYDEMVEIRRYLHQYPEISFKEFQTAAYIRSFYEKLGIPVRSQVGGNGLVVTIKGSKPGKTVALRADFDALAIQDEKDVPYKSTVPGVSHACGHDGHTATLLVLGKTLYKMKDDIEGTIVLIHQHAEEFAPGGAKAMIEDGCLDNVDAIFGTHLWSMTPTGTIQYRSGPVMAAADRFEITVKGSGGHGAQPHKTKDAIVIGAQLVGNLQQIVSRRVNPLESAVVSVGSFVAENAFNVIADSARLIGTVRTFNEDIRNDIEQEIGRIVQGTCLTADATYEYNFYRGYPAVVNHEDETEFAVRVAKDVPGVQLLEETEPHMGGEDFAYYLQHTKGTFFFTGAKPKNVENPYPHHHPKFDFDEHAMLIAANTLGSLALNYLEQNKTVKEAAKMK
ncbi:M20 family metallopeptidase [Metabacillus iocasae]|uniref:Amidohydrolase n=1 Tax=Priestia iocasae TaxID=2291674 RepID=A0ABS2QTA3_9BACI|nr:M20 family metallopeptidase [Metabacillus iocasae]MBM7702674.1 amidohydrolase [Metabacillus iocasae]